MFSAARIRDAIIHFEMMPKDQFGSALAWSDHLRDCQKRMRDGGYGAYDIDHMRGASMAEVGRNGMAADERTSDMIAEIMTQDHAILSDPRMADDWQGKL